MSDNNNVPEIRFHGFTDSWEDSCLAQNVDVRSGRDYKHLLKGDIPVFGTGGYMLSVNEALSYNEDAVGIGRKGTIDKPFILQAPFWTVDTLFYAVPKNTNDLQFIYDVFQKINWKEKDESTGVPSLSKVAINGIQMFSTSLPEQQKIGNYFQNVDKLITQSKNKHNQLVNLKKAMLEKMFPREGCSIPEIRFEGFLRSWSEKPLGFVADRYDNLRVPIAAKDRVWGRTPYYGANGIQGYVEGHTHDGEFILIAEDGANDLKNYPVQYVEGKIWVNNHAHVLQAKNGIADNKFLKYAFSNINIEPFLVGGGRAKLNANIMMNINIYIASDLQEQFKIGSYFENLDKLIALQKQQLEKLKNIKKACLDKMFV
ncbi:restriction endonuclease subunit S [Aliivibrio fischeri]|uniref:restriction endonuclease subunit S n=1 Tax=Aliivibrio fischeri TaxID=668 RepID=UPI00080DE6BE|nr:restriction endonuclease subunit S [Aliivibrio fischeri]OCH41425.1 restriction endonuclease subunit S [Aliivibrio fischeri]